MEVAMRLTEKEDSRKEEALLREIREVEKKMRNVEDWFNAESDVDLLEACIYEQKSLRARYQYLICLARREGISFHPFRN